MPWACAAARRLALVLASVCFSHNTLPGTRCNNDIQRLNTGPVIFQLLLKQQKTKLSSASPASRRDGAVPMRRLVSLGKKQCGSSTNFSQDASGFGATTA